MSKKKINIGEKIAKARKEINLSQDQLAESLEVTRQTISKWESHLAFSEAHKIAELSKILNVSCDYLLQEYTQDKGVTFIPTENSYTID